MSFSAALGTLGGLSFAFDNGQNRVTIFAMENFDDFSWRLEYERENKERLGRETKEEWEILKGLVSRFGIDRQPFDGYQFETSEESGRRLLFLNTVAATLYDRSETDELPTNCTVLFRRQPRTMTSVFPGPSPIEDKTHTSAFHRGVCLVCA